MAELTQRIANTSQGVVDASCPEKIILLRSRSREESRVVSEVDLFIVESGPLETKRGVQKHGAEQGGRTA